MAKAGWQRFRAWAKKDAPAEIRLPKFFPPIKFHEDVLWFVEGNIFGLLVGFLICLILIKNFGL